MELINCRYPIASLISSNSTKKVNLNKSVTFYYISNGKDTCTFDSGIFDGAKGKCIERMGPYDYYVSNDRLFVTRNAGTVEYIITGKYLINTNGKHEGYIPNENSINASCTSNVLCYEEKIFCKNNTYVEKFQKSKNKGWYMKEGDLIAYVSSSTGGVPWGLVVY